MSKERIWILIADGTEARLCSTEDGSTTAISPEPGEAGPREPGRPGSTPRDMNEKTSRAWYAAKSGSLFCHSAGRRFADHLARLLDEAAHEGAYDGLVIVAGPRIRAALQRALSAETRALVIGEVVQDLPRSTVTTETAGRREELRH